MDFADIDVSPCSGRMSKVVKVQSKILDNSGENGRVVGSDEPQTLGGELANVDVPMFEAFDLQKAKQSRPVLGKSGGKTNQEIDQIGSAPWLTWPRPVLQGGMRIASAPPYGSLQYGARRFRVGRCPAERQVPLAADERR